MRPVLAPLFLACVCAPALAQVDSTWHWQLKAGPQYVRLNDPLGPFNGPFTGRAVNGFGYLVGAGLGTPVRHGLAARVEVLFSARNTVYDYDERQRWQAHPADRGYLEWGERSMHLRSIEVPLLLTWHRWPGLRLEAGPAMAWLLHATERVKGGRIDRSTVQDVDETIDRTAALAPVEWAAVIGADVEGPNGLSLGVRYWMGFNDLDAGHGAAASTSEAWQFAIGYVPPRARGAFK